MTRRIFQKILNSSLGKILVVASLVASIYFVRFPEKSAASAVYFEQYLEIYTGDFYRHESATPGPTTGDLGTVYWDTDLFSNATVYLEYKMKVQYGSSSNPSRLYIAPLGGSPTIVQSYTASGTYEERIAVTLTDNTEYTVQMSAYLGFDMDLYYARFVVVQETDSQISATASYVEMAGLDSSTSTSATTLAYRNYYYFDSSKFSDLGSTATLRATLKTGGSGTAYAELYNVTDSEVVATASGTSTVWEVATASVTVGTGTGELKTGKNYELRIYASSGATVNISSATLLLPQSNAGGVEDTQLVETFFIESFNRTSAIFAGTYDTTSSTQRINVNTASYAGGTVTVYFEASFNNSCATGELQLYRTASDPITSSLISSTTSGFQRVRDDTNLLSEFSASPALEVYHRCVSSTSGITTQNARLIINITGLPSGASPSAPTDLYINNENAQSGSSQTIYAQDCKMSAVFNDADTGDTSTKYRIQVAKDSGFTDVLWDSGSAGSTMASCTEGNRCADITYNNDVTGSALPLNDIAVFWRIKYWDAADTEGAWSNTASFYMYGPEDYTRHGRVFNESNEDFFLLE